MTTTTHHKKLDTLSMKDIIDSSSPFAFFYEDETIPTTVIGQNSVGIKKIKKKIDIEEKNIKKYTETWSSYAKTFFKPVVNFPEIDNLETIDQMREYINTNYSHIVPDKILLNEYRHMANYGKIISTVKDTNDYILLFERSYNQIVANDKKQMEMAEKIAKGTENGMLMSGRLRSLKTLFDETEESIDRKNQLFNYYETKQTVYKALRFIGGTIVWDYGKQFIIRTSIDYLTPLVGTVLAPYIGAPIYLIINFASVYANLGKDARENQSIFSKIKYSLVKGGYMAITDVIKTTVFPMMASGAVSVIMGTLVLDGIMAIFDPKLNTKRSDELAKSYGLLTLDREFVKNMLDPPRLFNVVNILGKCATPFVWLATIPEAVFDTLGISTVSKMVVPYPARLLLNTAATSINYMFKAIVYVIAVSGTIILTQNALQYTPIPGLIIELTKYAQENGFWSNSWLETIQKGLSSNTVTQKMISFLSSAISLTSSLFSISNWITVQGFSGINSLIKNSPLIYMAKNHKAFMTFLSRTTMTMFISPAITTMIKANSQHFMIATAPLLYAAYMQNPMINRVDGISSLAFYGAIGASVSVISNIIFHVVNHVIKNKSTIDAFDNIDAKHKKRGSMLRWVDKIKYTLSSNLLFMCIDDISIKMRNIVAGSWIDYVETKFGRRDFFQSLSFTGLTNRLVIDGYIQKNLTNAVVNFASNWEVLEKIGNVNDEVVNNVPFDIDAVRRNFEKSKADNAVRVKGYIDKLSMLSKDPKSEDNTAAIEKTQAEIEKYKIMDDFYHHVENNFLVNPNFEISSLERRDVISSIFINNFNPFLLKVDTQNMHALEYDLKVQFAKLEQLTNSYEKKISECESYEAEFIKKLGSFNLNNLSIKQNEERKSIQDKYDSVRRDFNDDKDFKDTVDHIRLMEQVVLKQFSFDNVRTAMDLSTYYKRADNFSEMSKKLSHNIETIKPIFKESILSDNDITSSASLGILKKWLGNPANKVNNFTNAFKESANKAYQKAKEDITNAVIGPIINSAQETLTLLLRTSAVRRTTILKRLEDLRYSDNRLKITTTPNDPYINFIDMCIKKDIDELITLDEIVLAAINNASKDVEGINKPFIQSLSKMRLALETRIETQTSTGIETYTEFSTDYMTLYETSFGIPSSDDGQGVPLPYTDDQVLTQQLTNIVPFISGQKISVSAPGLEHVKNCHTDVCTHYDKFIDTIPVIVKDTVKEIKDILSKKYVSKLEIENESWKTLSEKEKNEYIDSNLLLFATMIPELKTKLTDLPKLSPESIDALKIMYSAPTLITKIPDEARLRYFNTHFKEGDIPWTNEALIFMLSSKTYTSSYIQQNLAISNQLELDKQIDPIKNELLKEQDGAAMAVKLLGKEYTESIKVEAPKVDPKVEDPKVEDEKPGYFSQIGSKIGSYFGGSLLSAIVGVLGNFGKKEIASFATAGAVTLNAPDFIINKLVNIRQHLDGFQDQLLDVESIKQNTLSKINDISNNDIRKDMTKNLNTWYEHAVKVNDLKYQIDLETRKAEMQCFGEYMKYSSPVIRLSGGSAGRDISGWLTPSINDILTIFFVDDKYGIKKQIVYGKDNNIPNKYKDISANIPILPDANININT